MTNSTVDRDDDEPNAGKLEMKLPFTIRIASQERSSAATADDDAVHDGEHKRTGDTCEAREKDGDRATERTYNGRSGWIWGGCECLFDAGSSIVIIVTKYTCVSQRAIGGMRMRIRSLNYAFERARVHAYMCVCVCLKITFNGMANCVLYLLYKSYLLT